MTKKQTTKKENYEKEEWGGWKIVSDMLDHPDKNRTYQTSECYQKLYDFVMAQKRRARQQERARVREMIEGMKKMKIEPDWDDSNWAINDGYNTAIQDLLEKLNKEK